MVICHRTVLIIFLGTGVCLNMMNTSVSTVSGETNPCSHLLMPRQWQSGLVCKNEMNRNEGCQQDHSVKVIKGNCSLLLPATWTRSAVVTFLGFGPTLNVSAGPRTLQINSEEQTKLIIVCKRLFLGPFLTACIIRPLCTKLDKLKAM